MSGIPAAGLAGNPVLYRLIFMAIPVQQWPANGWGGADGSTALLSGAGLASQAFAQLFSRHPSFLPVFLPHCGLRAGIRSIDGNWSPGGVRQGYPQGSGQLTEQLPLEMLGGLPERSPQL